MQRKWKPILAGLFLAIALICTLVYSNREALLTAAGEFMAPQVIGTADIAILEGSDYIRAGVVKEGINLLATGKVKRIVIVLHNIAPSHRPFGILADYPGQVGEELKRLGLAENDFKVIVVSIHKPVTLTEARNAVPAIAQEGVKSAVLLAYGFHARRSYLIYQYLTLPHGIKIFPYAYFGDSQREKWWEDDLNVRDFAAESVKLVWYLAAGHIPLKLSYE